MSVRASRGDAELLAATRNGAAAAYRRLQRRHVSAAWALVRRLVADETEAARIVEETFARVHHVIGRGCGPEQAFRPYLLTALRRAVRDRSGLSGRPQAGAVELFDPGVPLVDPALAGLERSPVAKAFLSLPERWRLVLWHVDVEGAGPADVAPLLGLTADDAAVLAHRAREGMRQACLRVHLAGRPRPECRAPLAGLGPYVRGDLGHDLSRAVDEHLDTCSGCRRVLAELAGVTKTLRAVIGPLVAGPAFAGYLAAARGAGAVPGRGPAIRWRRASRPVRRAVMTGAAVTAVMVAAALVLVSAEEPTPPPLVAPEPIVVAPTPEPSGVGAPASGLPDVVTPAPEPSGVVTPSGEGPAAHRADPGSPRTGPGLSGAGPGSPGTDPGGPGGAAGSPAAGHGGASQGDPGRILPEEAEAVPRLAARIDVLGALVRSETGIVAVRMRNTGRKESGEVVADVTLPRGVAPLVGAGRGRAAPGGVTPVGTVDGWSCRVRSRGARCVRGPLEPGRATAVFLRVLVSAAAAEGAAPSVRVRTTGARVTARSHGGVRTHGTPARFATDGRVAVSAIGNTLLSCPADHAGCERARARRGGVRDNDHWEMRPVDRDGDPSTSSSSAARLRVPASGEVVWAGLYWSASARPGDRTIRFRVPGDARYRRVKASRVVERRLPAGWGYQAFADVTRLLGRAGGTYWAADPSLRPGVSRHAGWSLVVITADQLRPYSRVVVVDAAAVLDRERRVLNVRLGGLASAAAPANLTLVTWEGDADVRGDRVALGGRTLRPTGGDRDPRNPFDGSVPGSVGTGVTFGTDVDRFRTPLGRDPVLRLSTRRDVLLFGAAVASVPAPF
ncbi:DNA-directed RNA polymerase specialized sigma24 family protein [Streptosporangium becharense]|uniref:DNA-directed RNA polymerase specialized sigma24 family protein n=1 Tax=Streptosporangium becharense TaxID=1816182 RepID=A0A7W9IH71_9ACTN|nr:zf-HC2 domain-containing protein [Streptosporangium becharense]MBB2908924.1 DNA-directed RNA polymerase specialized sigma24 family protein [Streptosporangium becharense]MBB5820058.1 DNA-directed RNA polymerase specialized sigma24 family protein [Streptosporangium becharense]